MYSQGTGEGRAELLKTSVELHQCQTARNFFSSSFRHVRALELRGSKEAFIHVKISIKKKKVKNTISHLISQEGNTGHSFYEFVGANSSFLDLL